MPEITVSESLYRQLEKAADGGDIDQAMWRMVGEYKRGHVPGD